MKPMPMIPMLTISNVFMTLAWYGHLKFKGYPLFTVYSCLRHIREPTTIS